MFDLSDELSDGLEVRTLQTYYHLSGRVKGEVDLLVINYAKKRLHLFEEKSKDTDSTRWKAYKQLTKAYRHFKKLPQFREYEVKTYFLCQNQVSRMYLAKP